MQKVEQNGTYGTSLGYVVGKALGIIPWMERLQTLWARKDEQSPGLSSGRQETKIRKGQVVYGSPPEGQKRFFPRLNDPPLGFHGATHASDATAAAGAFAGRVGEVPAVSLYATNAELAVSVVCSPSDSVSPSFNGFPKFPCRSLEATTTDGKKAAKSKSRGWWA